MALTDDQRAMIRLLAQREEGYEDIAALMGLSVGEVRARVREALAELGSEASAAGPVAGDRGRPRAGASSTPPSPAPPAEEAAEPKGDGSAPDGRRPGLALTGLKLPKDRGARIGLGAGAAAVAVLIVVLALSGGDSNSTTTTAASTAAEPAAVESKELTQAVLSPVNGGAGKGRALFGRIKKTPVLQVEATGLEPSPKGSSYTVWLYKSPQLVLRVGAVSVGKSGGIGAQFPIPTELLAYVASGAFDQVDVSLTNDAAYRAEVAKAKREKRLPAYTGEDVLRGKITGPAVKK
jgi:hypothetical protein